MDRRSTIIAGIIGTAFPFQSAIFAQASTAPHSWQAKMVTYNLIAGCAVTTITGLLLVRRAAMHAYRDWLSIRAARKVARKLEVDLEIIAQRTSDAAARASSVTLETIHPPKP